MKQPCVFVNVCLCVLWNKRICTTYQFWVVAYSSHQVVKFNPEGVSEENGFTLNSISNVLFSDETAARVSPPAGSHDDQQQEKLGGSFSVHWNSHKTQHNKRVKKKQSQFFVSLPCTEKLFITLTYMNVIRMRPFNVWLSQISALQTKKV